MQSPSAAPIAKAFSEADLTEDLKKIDVPILIMRVDNDQTRSGAD